jgi:hypothetical protein
MLIQPSRYDRQTARETRFKDLELTFKHLLSTNDKTRASVNFPIVGTCDPSDVCKQICYACSGHFTHATVQKANMARFQYFCTAPVQEVADRVYYEAKALGLRYLRWNGSGDLFPASVRVINHLAATRGDLVNVVYSRKPGMINQLAHDPKHIIINISLDRASLELPARITHPHVRYTYLRMDEGDTPPAWSPELPLEVVFANHDLGHKLSHEPRTCAATNGRMPNKDACHRCMRCFMATERTAAAFRGKYEREHAQTP